MEYTKLNKYKSILIICFSYLVTSCISETKYNNSIEDNFESLWRTIDERYCYLETKKINWDSIYTEYKSRINNNMPRESFFYLMGEMLNTLQDGHVALYSSFDILRYDDWYKNYPKNFDYELVEDNYLKNYKTASGLRYQILPNNIGYIYYNSFTNAVGDGNINEVIKYLITCKGIIIDVRDNTGGQLSNSQKLTSPFINEKKKIGYITHKIGKGHDDFSQPYAIFVEPYKGVSYFGKVALLTNRKCFSSTNDYVNSMKNISTVMVFGDITGGGGGLPFTSEMPNGWGINFSSSPMYNTNFEHLEFGIGPDVYVELSLEDKEKGIDSIIETAINWINE